MLSDLQTLLKEFWRQAQKELSFKWNRSVSFGDYVVDRWEKARALGFGEGTSVYDNVLILGDVKVGKNTWIGPNTILDGSGGLQIGDHCAISAGVQIYSHDTVMNNISGGAIPSEKTPTSIGSFCYIGPNTVISRGVTIGDHCIIGSCSLVLMNIPSYSKAYGTPCRIVGSVDITKP